KPSAEASGPGARPVCTERVRANPMRLNHLWRRALSAPRRRMRPRSAAGLLAVEALEDRSMLSAMNLQPTINLSHRNGPQSEVGIAVNPTNPLNLVSVSNDISDLNHLPTYTSFDGGASWITRLIDAS